MMECVIRKYKETDGFDLALLSNDEWKEGMMQYVIDLYKYDKKENNIDLYCIAEIENKIVGFIHGYTLPDKMLIPKFMYVKPEYRNRGIGAKLLRMLENESGCVSSLIFYENNLSPHYAKQGYVARGGLESAMKWLCRKGDENQ